MKFSVHITKQPGFIILAFLVSGILFYSCANRAAGPTGGPKDTIPPVVIKTNPLNGTVNFKKKLIEIYFDENVELQKANENVIVSPAQKIMPEIRANARSLTLELQDELIDNTTYSLNFGDAIVDLNEKNPLHNYTFAFATGAVIDTLKISGIVISAENLSPSKGIYVGIYKEDDDSVFFSQPFSRIAKTDENGRFTIDNVRTGMYRIYALGDANRDYIYQPGEEAAFIDSLVAPFAVTTVKADTIWKDSVKIDTIKSKVISDYYPQNLLFKLFKENYKRQYLVKTERKQPECFTFYFNATQAELPVINPLNFEWEGRYSVQKNATQDTLTYWLTDAALVKQDTLTMAVNYLKTDSLNRLVPSTDTLNIVMRLPKATSKPKKAALDDVAYKFNTNLSQVFDVFNAVRFSFESPLRTFDMSKIHLAQKVDTVMKPLEIKWLKSDSISLTYRIEQNWEPEANYELKIDSAAFTSIYGNISDKFSSAFKIKSLDEYSSIKLQLEPAVPNAVVQVLDEKDKVVAQKKADLPFTKIEFLRPGDYYLRLFVDENGNGKWDPGSVKDKKQPEAVYYYPKKLSLMANWEFGETWDINALPLLQQKPEELYVKKTESSAPKR